MTTDDLRALAQRIRDAVAHRLPRGLRQVDVVCEARGIRTRATRTSCPATGGRVMRSIPLPASNALPDTDPRVVRVHAIMRVLGFPIAPVRVSRATGPGAKSWRNGLVVVGVHAHAGRAGVYYPFSIHAEAATLDAAADALVRHALDTLAQEIRTLRNRGEARRSDAARLIYEAERVEAHADALAAALATMQGAGGGA